MDPNELNGLMTLLDSMDNDFVERSPPREKNISGNTILISNI